MGQPAEVYLFGPQLWLFGISSFACIPIIGYIFIPFYHKMQYTSAYKVGTCQIEHYYVTLFIYYVYLICVRDVSTINISEVHNGGLYPQITFLSPSFLLCLSPPPYANKPIIFLVLQ